MARDVLFGPRPAEDYELAPPVAHFRVRWSDDWVSMDRVYPLECVWCCGPAIPTATLRYDYGMLRQLNSILFDAWKPQEMIIGLGGASVVGLYVRIRWYCEVDAASNPGDDPEDRFVERYWHGIAEIRQDTLLGVHEFDTRQQNGQAATELVAAGSITVNCYGLEQLLAREPIRKSFFDRGGGITSNDSAIAFNAGGRPNASRADYDGAPVFWYDPADSNNCEFWSTRTIVKYLIRRCTPKDSLGARQLIWRCPDADKLPNWDTPQIETDGQTVLSLIQRLVSRQRLYNYWVEVNEDGGVEYADLRIETLAPNDVPITARAGAKVPAVTTKINAIFDRDPATTATVRDAGVQRYDVVHVRGAPLLYVGTFSWEDGTLEKGWTDDAEVDYEEGASLQPNFAGANLDTKQRMNAAARSAAAVEDVYSRFTIPPDWNQRVGDGEGGPTVELFVSDFGTRPVFWPSMLIEPDLPLFAEVDYTQDKITTGVAVAAENNLDLRDIERRPVLVCFQRTVADSDGEYRWYRAEDMGKLAKLPGVDPEDADRISVHVSVPRDGHSVLLRVSGGDQHAIAPSLFSAQPNDPKNDEWDVTTGCTVTVALTSGERVESRFPPNDPGHVDNVRRLVIDAGDQYERIYVAPNAVLDIGRNGSLARSTGGWIDRPTNVSSVLRDIAAIAAAWYTAPHKTVSITSARMLSAAELQLGDMIEDIGDRAIQNNPHVLTVNAPITQISFRWPLVESVDDRSGPEMSIETFAGELDPLAIGPGSPVGNPFKPRRIIDL